MRSDLSELKVSVYDNREGALRRVQKLETGFEVLRTKLAIYSGIGAFVGGALFQVGVMAFQAWIN